MDELELLARDLLAAAASALTPGWRQLIDDTQREGDDVTVVNAALEAMHEGGLAISQRLHEEVLRLVVNDPDLARHYRSRADRGHSKPSTF